MVVVGREGGGPRRRRPRSSSLIGGAALSWRPSSDGRPPLNCRSHAFRCRAYSPPSSYAQPRPAPLLLSSHAHESYIVTTTECGECGEPGGNGGSGRTRREGGG